MAMNKRKKFKILLTIEVLVVIALLGVLAFFMLFNGVNRQEINKKNLAIKKDIKGFTNIILFGVDAREGQLSKSTKDTRSDTMILVTINEDTKEVSLTSFYRDYYSFSPKKAGGEITTNLDDKKFDKLTHAYVYGPENAIKTLNMNFDLDIQHYVSVNFLALVRVVDQLDGITVDVNKKFMIKEINKYGGEIARKNGEPFKKITKLGVQTLNGYQALGYARTRKKDSDFNRAQRQREVINKVFEKIKSGAGLTKLTSIYNSITKNMITNYTNTEILALLKDAPKYTIRKETNNNYGNGYPYHAHPFTYNGVSLVFSKTPYNDIVLLHYNLFNNGVIPPELQTTNNTNTETNTANSTEGTTEEKGLGYTYSPSPDVLNIANYLANVYKQNAPNE